LDSAAGEGLSYSGESIPLEPEDVESLPRESTPESTAAALTGQAFTEAEKSLQTTIAEFLRLPDHGPGRG
jgi:hypothetical protein